MLKQFYIIHDKDGSYNPRTFLILKIRINRINKSNEYENETITP